MFSWKARARSFRYAFRGIRELILREHNAWIHIFMVVLVIAAGLWLRLSRQQWIDIVLAIGLVLSAEAFNTCVERMADLVAPEKNEQVGFIKDLAAGAVLLAALSAAAVGLLVFIPKLIHLWF